jgi:glyoxylase I family protein
MPRALHHVALGALGVEGLARFYAEVFGLAECARHHDSTGELRSIWLDLAGTVLMIERTDAAGPRVEGVGFGPFLLAFAVSKSERAELERELIRRGCPIEARSAFSSYARDPEGHRIAISHYPER